MEEGEVRALLLGYMEKRFRIPEATFDPYALLGRKESWWLLHRCSALFDVSSLKVKQVGLRAFRRIRGSVKPTTRMVQIFGDRARRAVVAVKEEDLPRLRSGRTIPVALDIEPGYVILTLGAGRVLGVGVLRRGQVASRIPLKELRETRRIGRQPAPPGPDG